VAIAHRLLQTSRLADLRSDRHLVRAAQKGDGRAASALIERYYPRIFSFVSYLGANGHAEDLAQEVFARALTALPRFNGTYQVGPWLLRIAKNLCIDESRRESFRTPPVDPAELPELEREESSDDVWESVSQTLAGSAVHAALARMPTRQRIALVLKELQGSSYAEIAEVIGTNVRGAEATLRRARARFRMEIANVDGLEAERAVCQRVLRALARGDVASPEVARHLKACSDCRSRASLVRSADQRLGALPPVVLGRGLWRTNVVEMFRPRPPRGRGLLEFLRGHGELGFLSPLSQVAEAVASFTLATAVSVASVGGVAAQVGVSLAAPPAAPAFVGATAAGGDPRTSVASEAGVASGNDTNSPSPVQAEPASGPPTTTSNAPAAQPAEGSLETSVSDAAETAAEVVAPVVETATGALASVVDAITTDPAPVKDDEAPLPLPQVTGTLPGGVALPRRRRPTFWS
jgi:RNA polymerase sigma-70 factor (ECF subfamily)